jgi:hypothetical protein
MGLRGRLIWVVTGLLAAAFLSRMWDRGTASKPDSDERSIDYLGQPVHLTKAYDSYEEYKDDPNNIAPEENARVAKLVAEAPIQKRFPNRKEMIDAVFALKFPGYGLSSFGDVRQPDGSDLSMQAIEVPRADRDRFFVFRGTSQGYVLIDDFIAPSNWQIQKVSNAGGKLIYSNRAGKPLATHTPLTD